MAESPTASSKFPIILSIGLACGLFLYQFGFRFLDPTNIGYIFRHGGDIAANYLGWAFLRNEPWSFPLGKITRYFAPLGTYAALTGLNPFCWIPFKLISPILPVDFYYSGWWVLCCYCLQAYFGYRLMRLITDNTFEQTLGAFFFLLSPPLIIRILTGQDTLASHWLILASFALYFENYAELHSRRFIISWSLLIVCACAIFPYFCPMVISIAIAFSIRHLIWTPSARPKLVMGLALYPLVALGSYIIFGYAAGGTSYSVTGYGTNSLNLNAFINPLQWSSFLPGLSYRMGQVADSFNYLGLGIIFLFICGIIHLIIRPRKIDQIKYLLPLIFVLLIFFLYAVSNRVTWGNTTLLKYNLPEPLLKMASMFRGSGRFGWPLFYAILYAGLFAVTAIKRKSLALTVMCICLAIQLVDIHPLLSAADFHHKEPVDSLLKSPLWQSAANKFNKIIIYPPFIQAITRDDDFKYLALYAYKNNMSINTGYIARWPATEMKAYNEELTSSLRSGDLDPKGIYIFADPPSSETVQLFHGWNRCALVDDYIIYTSDDHFFNGSNRIKIEAITLDDLLKRFEQDTILIAAREYVAPVLLPQNVKQYLQKKGSQLAKVTFCDSYVSVISNGLLVQEILDTKKPAKIELRQGQVLGQGKVEQDIVLYSTGVDLGNEVSIKVASVERAKNRGGLNIVVLNKNGKIVLSTIFDVNTGSKVNYCTLTSSP